jgi:RHS repeat-associated protein
MAGKHGDTDDGQAGFVRFGARDYDPVAGRWTAMDRAGFVEREPNLYIYALNSPVTYIDPIGRFGLVGAVIGAGIELGIQGYKNYKNYKNGCDVFNLGNYDWWDVGVSAAVGALAPGWGSVGKTAARSGGAIRNLTGQLGRAKAVSKVTKLTGRVSDHRAKIKDAITTQLAYQGAKAGVKAANDALEDVYEDIDAAIHCTRPDEGDEEIDCPGEEE